MSKRMIVIEHCTRCPYAEWDVLNKFQCSRTGLPCSQNGFPDWCPLPKMLSEEDIVDMFAKHCYPIRYDTNSVEQGMTIAGIRQVIHEILYKNRGKKDE